MSKLLDIHRAESLKSLISTVSSWRGDLQRAVTSNAIGQDCGTIDALLETSNLMKEWGKDVGYPNGGMNVRILILLVVVDLIGCHTIKEALARDDIERLVNLDALTYSGNPENLTEIEDDRYRFIHGSINDGENSILLIEERISVILHLAAESHVDRSIDSSYNHLLKRTSMGREPSSKQSIT